MRTCGSEGSQLSGRRLSSRLGIPQRAKQRNTSGSRNARFRETTSRLDRVGVGEFLSIVVLAEANTVPLCPNRRGIELGRN